MKQLTLIIIFMFCVGIGSLAAEEKVVVGGSGSLTEEIAEVAKAYMAKHPSDTIQVLLDSMSNTGGMEGVKVGRLTIGLVTDEPQGADKEKLVYKIVGRSATAVAVKKSVPVSNLSEAQVCDMFSGKVKSWKEVGGNDAKIMVLTRKKDDANTEAMREKMGCFKNLHITPDGIALVRGSEVLDALDKRSGTVGIVNVSKSLSDRRNAKTVAIDGVSPSADAVQAGKYKFSNERGVVTLGAPKGAAKRFLDFMAEPEASKILARLGLVSVK
jgi:phosphate transport system substrate-binding protein